MAGESHFGPQLFEFLRELRANNNRDWFGANKTRYEEQVLDVALRFIQSIMRCSTLCDAIAVSVRIGQFLMLFAQRF